jgi:hypothetical protein
MLKNDKKILVTTLTYEMKFAIVEKGQGRSSRESPFNEENIR